MARRYHRGAGAVLLAAACHRSLPPVDTGFVAKWPETNFALARAERLSPPVASRVAAYVAVALFEGWAASSDSLRSLAGQLKGLDSLPRPEPGARYDPASVAVEAQTTVLRALYADGFPSTAVAITRLHDSLMAVRSGTGVPEDVARASREYGARLGGAIIEWARKDGFAETRQLPFTMPVGPQYWVPTATPAQYRSQNLSGGTDIVLLDNPTGKAEPRTESERSLTVNRPKRPGTTVPGIDPTKPVEPHWGELRTFGIPDADTCQAPKPAPFSPEPGSDFYAQAQRVYQVSKTLTAEQRRTAQFWADNPGESGTPASHWLMIVAQVATQRRLSPERTAEAYALTAIATADAFIACWHLKYQVNLLRPVTYIQRYIDPRWQTVLVTPPFPEYASGHAIQSAASAEVLTALLGDETPFEDATHVSIGHPPRHFASFRKAAAEAAMSRLYGGIHYPMGNDNGAAQGRCIGRTVLDRVHTRR